MTKRPSSTPSKIERGDKINSTCGGKNGAKSSCAERDGSQPGNIHRLKADAAGTKKDIIALTALRFASDGAVGLLADQLFFFRYMFPIYRKDL